MIIFDRLCTVGLKVNAHKCIFRLNEISFLGNVIIKDGIKHYPKKVQGIMDLRVPTTMTKVK